jgi:predicted alpha/beta-hydrolase family hydrolase
MPSRTYESFLNDQPGEVPVRGFLHRASGAKADALVLTHGAGGNCNAPLLIALAEVFSVSGITVLRCDLPFRQLRPHGPPSPSSATRDQEGLRRAVTLLRRDNHSRIFLGGQSYGGRQATLLAANEPSLIEGQLLLSYPLHPPGKPAQLRTAHFSKLQIPSLFASGTRDAFGTIPELEAAIKLIPARTQLFPISGAGHGLASKQLPVPQMIHEAFAAFF